MALKTLPGMNPAEYTEAQLQKLINSLESEKTRRNELRVRAASSVRAAQDHYDATVQDALEVDDDLDTVRAEWHKRQSLRQNGN